MELSNSTIVSVGSRLRNVSNFMILAFSVPLVVGVAASTTYGQSCDNFFYFRICIGIYFIYACVYASCVRERELKCDKCERVRGIIKL